MTKQNERPTPEAIREHILRFLSGLDSKDLKGNWMLQHRLQEVNEKFFTYERTDQHGNVVVFSRNFYISDAGEVRISTAADVVNNSGAPAMPKARWNKEHKPDYSHLDVGPKEPEVQEGVPAMPRPKWGENGRPDFSGINDR